MGKWGAYSQVAASAFIGTVSRRSLPVKPGTQGSDPFTQVAHDIVGHLIGIHHQDRSTLYAQCHFPLLEAQAHHPGGVRDHDDAGLQIREPHNEPSMMAVPPRAALFEGLDHR
ncbi:hypothetical protein [Candidatus Methylacidithermus pantelleriae]|uniref:Uncharacterized protein n=1 Tax=Candidatus Methylacidithermus pantelleriae TaxID=2744239 RepID=A0A8J2BSZ9_9BACT|nr:hypothetical protein [Candidatus Methylacidithermus pantelleriae]CAF0705235.1 hypothetical protein MPNT_90016 [Candidatus Methylacidithermus pantelleriae]